MTDSEAPKWRPAAAFAIVAALVAAGVAAFLLRPAPVALDEADARFAARLDFLEELIGRTDQRHSVERIRRANAMAKAINEAVDDVPLGSDLDEALERLNDPQAFRRSGNESWKLILKHAPLQALMERWLEVEDRAAKAEFRTTDLMTLVHHAGFQLSAALAAESDDSGLWLRRLIELAEIGLVAPESYGANVGILALTTIEERLKLAPDALDPGTYRPHLQALADALPSPSREAALHFRFTLEETWDQCRQLTGDRDRGQLMSWVKELWDWEDEVLASLALPAGPARSELQEALIKKVDDLSDFVAIMASFSTTSTDFVEGGPAILERLIGDS